MTRISWKDLPSKDTPIKGDNLNKLNNLAIDTTTEGHEEEVVVVKTKNLFNKNDVTLNSAINTSTGEITSWDDHYATGYINVKGAETIYVSGNGTGSYYGVLYDSSKNYISDVSRSGAGTITIPSNAYYYRTTVMGSSYLDTMQVELGDTATDYTPYITSEIDTLNTDNTYSKYTDTVNIGVDSNNAGLWVEASKNKYDNSLKQAGYFTASTGALTTGDSNWYYQYVSVKPNTTYTISGITTTNDGIGASEFNSSKTFVQKALTYKNGTFTTSSTTYYLGISVRVGENDTFMLEVGDTATTYEPYITPSIKVNNNGTYETIYDKGTILYNTTAYSAKGSATKVPQITTNSLGQVTEITEVTITQPTVNNGTLTIQKNGTTVKTFTANSSSNVTANIEVPTNANIVDLIYPVGSIYMSVNSTEPSTLFGGTWEKIKDTFLLSSGDTYTSGSTGGEATHTLSLNEIPSHSHTSVNDSQDVWWDGQGGYYLNTSGGLPVNVSRVDTSSNGGGQAHNNMPPYLVVNVWKRTK